MKFINRTLLTVSMLLVGLSGSWADPKHDMSPYIGSQEFERIKSLAGHWEGLTTEMTPGQKEAQKVTVDYKVSSGGSVVVETLSAGTPHEMVSVYSDESGELVMKHYCLMKNQPKLTLTKSVKNEITLELDKRDAGVDPQSLHMHSVVITTPSQTQLIQKWTSYANGKPDHSSTFTYTKKS